MTLSDCQAESWPLLDCACMDHGSPGSPSDERLEVEGMAKLILYNLTGSKYGVCEVEIRPCTDTRVCCSYCGLGVGAFGQCCQCRVCGEITLPGPIHRVVDVMVDGELVPRETYRVDDRYWLVNLTGSWPRCFDGDTLVLTKRGNIPIRDVTVGDEVWTHKNRWRRVLDSAQTDVRETVTVKGRHGTITATPEHPFYASDVHSVWNNTIRRTERKLGAPDWERADQLVGKALATPSYIDPIDYELPDIEIPLNFWWFVGRWVGDGCVTGNKGGPRNRIVMVSSAPEREYMREQLHRTGWKWGESTDDRHGRWINTPRWRMSSASLASWLVENFGEYAHHKRIPTWLLGADESIRRDFLEGYVSADGWYGKSHNGKGDPFTSIHTVSRELAIGIRMLAVTLGYAAALYQGKANGISPTYKVNWSVNLEGSPYSQSFPDGEHQWNRVRKVTLNEDPRPVFDLTVEEDHSFVADGVVVHNCQDLRAAFDDGDAFTVWYEQGTPPPKGAGLAVGKLACELWKAFCGDDSCAIPGLATRITRQGITVELLDLFTMGTGIPAVDMWITSLEKTARTGRVYSPDTARGDRRTTQPPGSTSP